MKTILFFLTIVFALHFESVNARVTPSDSTKIVRTAKRDGHSFRLGISDLKQFHSEQFPTNSDYFKPTVKYTSNPAMLNDSLYVQTFRTVAFYQVINQRIPSVQELLHPSHDFFEPYDKNYDTEAKKTAHGDVKRFSLTKSQLKEFKSQHFSNTSDYFKPTVPNVSDPALLNDSGYVKTFRHEAFYKSFNQRVHPAGHALLITGIVLTSVVLVLVTINDLHS